MRVSRRRSCGPARCPSPAPGPTASRAHPAPVHRQKPAAAPDDDPSPSLPPPPRCAVPTAPLAAQLPVAAGIGGEGPVARRTSRVSLASKVTDFLCGSTPMTTRSTPGLLTRDATVSEDGQRYFELGRPFLSHASPRHPARTQPMKEPRPGTRRAAARRASSRAPHPSLRRPGRSWKTYVGRCERATCCGYRLVATRCGRA